MSKDNMGKQMADFLRLLANEIENNQAMAKRLSAPFEEMIQVSSKPAVKSKKEKVRVPEGFDPFKVYYDKGAIGLHSELIEFDAQTLKAILTYFSLDPSRSYTRWRKQERLISLIIEKVKSSSNKGQAFS
ncbi:hypothetical protein SYNTR_1817 [Candidatus Syntrophocurvum alkaliphilum]|uniref:Uncharacterized protein n=1 Tax=Candidatus Syntrophocurvum alkaliphilum TaxID=2293317 RepID=A0A6I6DM99_9FIRM|nr:hypothetical protein [Candidatus Syntrophocurvum alkaliphilum]QGU00411.1 hypothetical protein SYNTR_1817 [Candidatus Syntrophocurvum alkaliphilum]